jgi:putative transcriptional regulator
MNDRVRNHIKEYRLRRGLSQEELAKAVGVSRQSINSVERGRYTPSLALALKFARLFGCPAEQLFELQEEQ